MTDAEYDAMRESLGAKCYVLVRRDADPWGVCTQRLYMNGLGNAYTWTTLPCEATRKTKAAALDCRVEAYNRHGIRSWLLNLNMLVDADLGEFFESMQQQMRRMA